MLCTPIAVQSPRDLRFGPLALLVTEFGQLQRLTLAAQYRCDDGRAGDASNVADHLGQLDISSAPTPSACVAQAGRVADQHLPLPQVIAQYHHSLCLS